VDYITKPLRHAIVTARVQTHLELRRTRQQLQRDKAELEVEIAQRLRDKLVVQDITIRALARLAETRDNETGNHILRTQQYVELLAQLVSGHPRFAAELDADNIAMIAKSAPLHDIGKVGIPDSVLLKPGPLDAAEWAVMKTHAALGADAIGRAEADAAQPVKFLTFAKQVARHHHERWDGSGYPDGLAGEAIPLAARLMAVADVFDAMISRRVYKLPISMERVRGTMAEQRARHFDPDLLEAFLAHYDSFCAIAQRLPDESDAAREASSAQATADSAAHGTAD
jgi:putative two-component system response regulator